MNRWIVLVLLAAGGCVALTAPASAQDPPVIGDPEVSAPVTPFEFDGDVRDLPPAPQWKPGDQIKEIPRRFFPPPGQAVPEPPPAPAWIDLLDQAQRATPPEPAGAFNQPNRNFPGQGFSGVVPPDTVGDVGPNHYIQAINSAGGTLVRIYDKAEPTPATLATFTLDSLGSANCASGFGDPIVLYDRLADRWLISEFASSGNRLCVYISKTANPVSGGWFNYSYTAPSFPDYPKYAVWPTDATGGQGSYLITANDGGPGVYALNRGAMLAGTAGSYQRLTVPPLPAFGFQAPIASDLDGATGPPAMAPAIVLRHRDTEVNSGPAAPGDVLELWAFSVNWVNTAATTLTKQSNIDVADFDSTLCGLSSFNCFPQPGSGITLDPLREVVMWRLAYLNQGDHEALVGNFVTDVGATNHGGVRWFELRKTSGSGWSLFQEGTYAIDAHHRWMGSIAMDQSNNIALGYSVSSSTVFPSIRYTGRTFADPLNVMTQGETTIHAGTASNNSNRWGDYAAMSLDPTDDCTFWFTTLDNTSGNWRTQIASFRFEACGCLAVPAPPAAAAAPTADNVVNVTWNDSAVPGVSEYRIRRATTPGGPYTALATVVDSSPGAGGGPAYAYQDTTVSGGTTYYYVVIATDTVACTSDPSNEAAATATGLCTLAPLFDGLQDVTTSYDNVCTLELTWNPGTPRCGGPLEYDVHRSTLAGFVPGADNLLTTTGATAFADTSALVDGTAYHYVVRAVDLGNGLADGNVAEVSGTPQGTLIAGTWTDDGGDTGPAAMSLGGPWQVHPTEGAAGSKGYKTGPYNNNTCAALTSPVLLLKTGSVLTFVSHYDIQAAFDKGEVQISTNGGATWTRLPVNYPGSATQTGDNCALPTGTYFTGTDASYKTYTANLAAYNNTAVRIRFLLSTNPSVIGNGWWIDTIKVTNVDLPQPCATGSACLNNPFVDVTPDGPIAACVGDAQLLTAQLAGGQPPFVYQWTRDGAAIPGATSATLSTDAQGAHAYNVLVRGAGCQEDAVDGVPTQIEWEDAPSFAGISAAINGQDPTCTVDLSWSPAGGPCPGPITYSVYRDTGTPVSVSPSTLVAAGLAGTTYADAAGLDYDTTYHYVVRATDGSTGQSDGNAAEAAATPTGPGGGPQVLFAYDFSSPLTFFNTWTVTTGPGPHSCGTWSPSNAATQRPANGNGYFATSNASACAGGSSTSVKMDSVPINAALPSVVQVVLEYDVYYVRLSGTGGDATTEVWDGANWQVIWADADQNLDLHQSFDVTPYALGNPAFRVRFNYQNAAADGWFSVDNVVLTAKIDIPCAKGFAGGALPAPDGSGPTAPLLARRVDLAGNVIDLQWDAASCPATDYNLIHGDLAAVAAYAIGGGECALGTSGSHTWSGAPAGDTFFLIVGTDGAGTESSWGEDSAGNERNGPAPSGVCAGSVKNLTAGCP